MTYTNVHPGFRHLPRPLRVYVFAGWRKINNRPDFLVITTKLCPKISRIRTTDNLQTILYECLALGSLLSPTATIIRGRTELTAGVDVGSNRLYGRGTYICIYTHYLFHRNTVTKMVTMWSDVSPARV